MLRWWVAGVGVAVVRVVVLVQAVARVTRLVCVREWLLLGMLVVLVTAGASTGVLTLV